jgi:hypothetical protein
VNQRRLALRDTSPPMQKILPREVQWQCQLYRWEHYFGDEA